MQEIAVEENDNIYSNVTVMMSYPEYKWSLSICDRSDYRCEIRFVEAPNWFWRLTQRLILGFKWTKL